MHDVGFRQMMTNDRFETLRKAAARPHRTTHRTAPVELDDIELRLCKPADDGPLERLAALSERPVPAGRMVVALADGCLVAALPLAGGPPLADPFARTAHLVRLLELRAAQLRRPAFAEPRVRRLLRRHA